MTHVIARNGVTKQSINKKDIIMKNRHSIILISTLLITLLSVSCASKDKPPRPRDETYIADLNSFSVETFHLYAAFGLNQPKIQDFTIYFAPRNNYVYVYGRIGIDVIQAGFSYKERQKLIAAKEKYINDYEEKTLPKDKPTKKNAYSTGDVSFKWGAAGLTHETDTIYMTNVQYILDGKPYFRILFEQAKENDGSGNSSPRVSIYISPSQWEKIVEACNQDHLIQLTDDILFEAEEF